MPRPRSSRRRSSAATRRSRDAPTTSSTRSSSSRRRAPNYPVFIPLSGNPLLKKGSLLQAQGHQVSAERLYTKAVKLSPGDVEAQVAQAVGLFDEDNLNPSFSLLGPLTARYPKSQLAHYYFGLLLAWTTQRAADAIAQFEKAFALGPTTEIGKQAKNFLSGIAAAQSASPSS